MSCHLVFVLDLGSGILVWVQNWDSSFALCVSFFVVFGLRMACDWVVSGDVIDGDFCSIRCLGGEGYF